MHLKSINTYSSKSRSFDPSRFQQCNNYECEIEKTVKRIVNKLSSYNDLSDQNLFFNGRYTSEYFANWLR